MNEILNKGQAEARRFGGRAKAAAVAYPVVIVAVFLLGRWTAWLPLVWGL